MNTQRDNMLIETRPAHSSDTDFARTVHHQAYREVIEQQYGSWDEAAQDQFFQRAWDDAPHEIILCNGVPCGYLCIEHRPHDIHVRELVLVPVFHGQGIGSLLLRRVCECARQRNVVVRLQTQQKNRAVGLYRRLGFEEVGRTETHVLFEWRPTGISGNDRK